MNFQIISLNKEYETLLSVYKRERDANLTWRQAVKIAADKSGATPSLVREYIRATLKYQRRLASIEDKYNLITK